MKLAELYTTISIRGLATFNTKLKALRARLSGVVSTLDRVGRQARRAFLISAVAIGGAIYAAKKFEEQMAMVSTMLGRADMEWMGPFREGIRKLAVEFGEGTATLSKGLYDILSASIAPAKAMGVLTVAVRAARGGMTDTAVAADAITTILNSYRMSADKAGDVSDKLFATVKRGKLTFAELGSSIGKAAATAAMAGLSLEELLAAVSTITRAGIRSDRAMVAVVGTLRSFLKPTTEAKKLAKELGFAMDTATIKALGFSGVFKLMTHLSAEQLAVLFPNIRGLKGVAAAMGDLEGLAKDLSLQYSSLGLAEEAFGKTTDTMAMALRRAKAMMIDMAQSMGQQFKPMLLSVTSAVEKLHGAFGKLSGAEKGGIADLATGFAALAAATVIITAALKVLILVFTGIAGIIAVVGASAVAVVALADRLVRGEWAWKRWAKAAEEAAASIAAAKQEADDTAKSVIRLNKLRRFGEKYAKTAPEAIPLKTAAEIRQTGRDVRRRVERWRIGYDIPAPTEEEERAIGPGSVFAKVEKNWRRIVAAQKKAEDKGEQERKRRAEAETRRKKAIAIRGMEMADIMMFGTPLERALLRLDKFYDEQRKRADKAGLSRVELESKHQEAIFRTKKEFQDKADAEAKRISRTAATRVFRTEEIRQKRAKAAADRLAKDIAEKKISITDYLIGREKGPAALALTRLKREVQEMLGVGVNRGLVQRYTRARIGEIRGGGGRERGGQWMGLASVWRGLQAAATKPELQKLDVIIGELNKIVTNTGKPKAAIVG